MAGNQPMRDWIAAQVAAVGIYGRYYETRDPRLEGRRRENRADPSPDGLVILRGYPGQRVETIAWEEIPAWLEGGLTSGRRATLTEIAEARATLSGQPGDDGGMAEYLRTRLHEAIDEAWAAIDAAPPPTAGQLEQSRYTYRDTSPVQDSLFAGQEPGSPAITAPAAPATPAPASPGPDGGDTPAAAGRQDAPQIRLRAAPGTEGLAPRGAGQRPVSEHVQGPASQVWVRDDEGTIWAWPITGGALILVPDPQPATAAPGTREGTPPAAASPVPGHVRALAGRLIGLGGVTVRLDPPAPATAPDWQVSFVRGYGEEVTLIVPGDLPSTVTRAILFQFEISRGSRIATGQTELPVTAGQPATDAQLTDWLHPASAPPTPPAPVPPPGQLARPDGTRPLAQDGPWHGPIHPDLPVFRNGTPLAVRCQGQAADQTWHGTAAGTVPGTGPHEPGVLQVIAWDLGDYDGEATRYSVIHPALTSLLGTNPYEGLDPRQTERWRLFDQAAAAGGTTTDLTADLLDPEDVLEFPAPYGRPVPLATVQSTTQMPDGKTRIQARPAIGGESALYSPPAGPFRVRIPAGHPALARARAAAAVPDAAPAPAAGPAPAGAQPPAGTIPLGSHQPWNGPVRPERLVYADRTPLTVRVPRPPDPPAWLNATRAAVAAGVSPAADGGLLQVVRWEDGGYDVVHPARTWPTGTDPYQGLDDRRRRRWQALDAAEASPYHKDGDPANLPGSLTEPGDHVILHVHGQRQVAEVDRLQPVTGAPGRREIVFKGRQSPLDASEGLIIAVQIPRIHPSLGAAITAITRPPAALRQHPGRQAKPADVHRYTRLIHTQREKLQAAVASGDRDQVIAACREAVIEWNRPGNIWPPDADRWQAALDRFLPDFDQVNFAADPRLLLVDLAAVPAPDLAEPDTDEPDTVEPAALFDVGQVPGSSRLSSAAAAAGTTPGYQPPDTSAGPTGPAPITNSDVAATWRHIAADSSGRAWAVVEFIAHSTPPAPGVVHGPDDPQDSTAWDGDGLRRTVVSEQPGRDGTLTWDQAARWIDAGMTPGDLRILLQARRVAAFCDAWLEQVRDTADQEEAFYDAGHGATVIAQDCISRVAAAAAQAHGPDAPVPAAPAGADSYRRDKVITTAEQARTLEAISELSKFAHQAARRVTGGYQAPPGTPAATEDAARHDDLTAPEAAGPGAALAAGPDSTQPAADDPDRPAGSGSDDHADLSGDTAPAAQPVSDDQVRAAFAAFRRAAAGDVPGEDKAKALADAFTLAMRLDQARHRHPAGDAGSDRHEVTYRAFGTDTTLPACCEQSARQSAGAMSSMMAAPVSAVAIAAGDGGRREAVFRGGQLIQPAATSGSGPAATAGSAVTAGPEPEPAPLCLYDSPARGLAARQAERELSRARQGSGAAASPVHAWRVQPSCPDTATDQCQTTILSADLRRFGKAPVPPCGHDGPLLYRACCRRPGCDWEGPERDSENAAAEDGCDHAWPGWRDLPAVPEPPRITSGTTKAERAAIARWTDQVNLLYRPGWVEDGGPVRTRREASSGTRHVPAGTPYGGYELAIVSGADPGQPDQAPHSQQVTLAAQPQTAATSADPSGAAPAATAAAAGMPPEAELAGSRADSGQLPEHGDPADGRSPAGQHDQAAQDADGTQQPSCTVCGEPLDPVLRDLGDLAHPLCVPPAAGPGEKEQAYLHHRGEMHAAAGFLATLPGYAQTPAGPGFTTDDTCLGLFLADLPVDRWTNQVSAAAWHILSRYAGQLSQAGITDAGLPGAEGMDDSELAVARQIAERHMTATWPGLLRDRFGDRFVRCDGYGAIVMLGVTDSVIAGEAGLIPGARAWVLAAEATFFPFGALADVVALAGRYGIPVTPGARALAAAEAGILPITAESPDTSPAPGLAEQGADAHAAVEGRLGARPDPGDAPETDRAPGPAGPGASPAPDSAPSPAGGQGPGPAGEAGTGEPDWMLQVAAAQAVAGRLQDDGYIPADSDHDALRTGLVAARDNAGADAPETRSLLSAYHDSMERRRRQQATVTRRLTAAIRGTGALSPDTPLHTKAASAPGTYLIRMPHDAAQQLGLDGGDDGIARAGQLISGSLKAEATILDVRREPQWTIVIVHAADLPAARPRDRDQSRTARDAVPGQDALPMPGPAAAGGADDSPDDLSAAGYGAELPAGPGPGSAPRRSGQATPAAAGLPGGWQPLAGRPPRAALLPPVPRPALPLPAHGPSLYLLARVILARVPAGLRNGAPAPDPAAETAPAGAPARAGSAPPTPPVTGPGPDADTSPGGPPSEAPDAPQPGEQLHPQEAQVTQSADPAVIVITTLAAPGQPGAQVLAGGDLRAETLPVPGGPDADGSPEGPGTAGPPPGQDGQTLQDQGRPAPGTISPLHAAAASGGRQRPHRLVYPEGTALVCRPDGQFGPAWAGVAAGSAPAEGGNGGLLQGVRRSDGGLVSVHPAVIAPAGVNPYAWLRYRDQQRFSAFDPAEAAGLDAAWLTVGLADIGDQVRTETAPGSGRWEIREVTGKETAGIHVQLTTTRPDGDTRTDPYRSLDRIEVMIPARHPAEDSPYAARLYAPRPAPARPGPPGGPAQAPAGAIQAGTGAAQAGSAARPDDDRFAELEDRVRRLEQRLRDVEGAGAAGPAPAGDQGNWRTAAASTGPLRQALTAAGETITGLRQEWLWTQLCDLADSTRRVARDAAAGRLRFSDPAGALRSWRQVWAQVCELTGDLADAVMTRLRPGGPSWRAARRLRHAATEAVAHARGWLPRDEKLPPGSYDPPPGYTGSTWARADAAAQLHQAGSGPLGDVEFPGPLSATRPSRPPGTRARQRAVRTAAARAAQHAGRPAPCP